MGIRMVALKTSFRQSADIAFKEENRIGQSTFLWGIGVLDVAAVQPDATEESVLINAQSSFDAAHPRVNGNWQCQKVLNIMASEIKTYAEELSVEYDF